MQTEKIIVKKVFEPNGKGPAALIDAADKKWKFWTTGKGGKGIPVDRFHPGAEYLIGYKTQQYNGVDEFYIDAIVDGQTAPIPKVLQRPSYRQASSPSERRSIEIQALAKNLPHWWASVEPNDVAALAGMINDIGKARDLSTLANSRDDMDGDTIPH